MGEIVFFNNKLIFPQTYSQICHLLSVENLFLCKALNVDFQVPGQRLDSHEVLQSGFHRCGHIGTCQCVCVCVCVRERERERERKSDKGVFFILYLVSRCAEV